MNRQEIIDSWNAQADEYNQWDDLGEDEKLEWAMQMEREAMVAEAAKLGWAMKNEDPFEDAVQEVATIRARSNT